MKRWNVGNGAYFQSPPKRKSRVIVYPINEVPDDAKIKK